MTRSVKCPVRGCPGIRSFATDGRGGVVESCPCCEKRAAWKAANLPDVVRLTCAICTGSFTVERKGAATLRKYCTACRPLADAASVRRGRVNQRAKVTPIRPLRSA